MLILQDDGETEEMIDNILIIGSLVFVFTSLSTTLRAVGKSRESLRNNRNISRFSGENINLYFITTIIWYCVSLLFIVPVIRERSVLLLTPHLVILLIIGLLWRDIKARLRERD
jgi:hypothetical protein